MAVRSFTVIPSGWSADQGFFEKKPGKDNFVVIRYSALFHDISPFSLFEDLHSLYRRLYTISFSIFAIDQLSKDLVFLPKSPIL